MRKKDKSGNGNQKKLEKESREKKGKEGKVH